MGENQDKRRPLRQVTTIIFIPYHSNDLGMLLLHLAHQSLDGGPQLVVGRSDRGLNRLQQPRVCFPVRRVGGLLDEPHDGTPPRIHPSPGFAPQRLSTARRNFRRKLFDEGDRRTKRRVFQGTRLLVVEGSQAPPSQDIGFGLPHTWAGNGPNPEPTPFPPPPPIWASTIIAHYYYYYYMHIEIYLFIYCARMWWKYIRDSFLKPCFLTWSE